MKKLIVATDQVRIDALFIGASDYSWVYNYQVRRIYKVLGLSIMKQVHIHTFRFDRWSDNAFRDGLRQAMFEQRARVALPLVD
jgi:hypothetical protein